MFEKVSIYVLFQLLLLYRLYFGLFINDKVQEGKEYIFECINKNKSIRINKLGRTLNQLKLFKVTFQFIFKIIKKRSWYLWILAYYCILYSSTLTRSLCTTEFIFSITSIISVMALRGFFNIKPYPLHFGNIQERHLWKKSKILLFSPWWRHTWPIFYDVICILYCTSYPNYTPHGINRVTSSVWDITWWKSLLPKNGNWSSVIFGKKSRRLFLCWINTDLCIHCHRSIRNHFLILLRNLLLWSQRYEWTRYTGLLKKGTRFFA